MAVALDTNLKVTDLVSKQTVEEMLNEMVLIPNVQHKWSKDFKKVGATVEARRPVYVEAIDGSVSIAGSFNTIQQQTVDITLEFLKTVALELDSVDATLGEDVMRENYSQPAAKELVQVVETEIASVYKEIYNFTGTAGTTPSTFLDVSDANVLLSELGTPKSMERRGFYTERAGASLANGLKEVFPQDIASQAIKEATIGKYAGIKLFTSNSLATHTAGAQGGTPLVDGSTQATTYAANGGTWTQGLEIKGFTASAAARVKEGDVFTIANVFAVNRRTRVSTGQLQQFVMTADASSDGSGDLTASISPPIITSGPYQTVDADVVDGAAILFLTGASGAVTPQNLVFVKDAIAFVMAPLAPARNGSSSTSSHMGISVRTTIDFDIDAAGGGKNKMRFDILFGKKLVAPDMAVRTTG